MKGKRKRPPIRKAYGRRIDAAELLAIFATEIRLSPASGASLKKRPAERAPSLEACKKLADRVDRLMSPLPDEQQRLFDEVTERASALYGPLERWLDLGGGWPPWRKIREMLQKLKEQLDAVGAHPVLSGSRQKPRGQPVKPWHSCAGLLAYGIKAALEGTTTRIAAPTNPESLTARVGARLIARMYFELGRDGQPRPLRITADAFAAAVRVRPSRGKRTALAARYPGAAKIRLH